MEFTSFDDFSNKQLNESDPANLDTEGDFELLHGIPLFSMVKYDHMHSGRGKRKWWKKFINDPNVSSKIKEAMKKYGRVYVKGESGRGTMLLTEADIN